MAYSPQPGQDGISLWDRFCLDRLCHGWYASCNFPQEDCLVYSITVYFYMLCISIIQPIASRLFIDAIIIVGGYVFTGVCLFIWGYPIPSHNTSTGSMSFPGGTPVTGPRSLPRGYPVQDGRYPSPREGVPQSCAGGTQDGVPLVRPGWGTPPGQDGVPPQPGQDGIPPPWDRLHLDRLCHRQYASCGFPQKDCLMYSIIFLC